MISRECIGASIAVLLPVPETRSGPINNYDVLAIQRDDFEGIRFRGMWEFPGGGAEPVDLLSGDVDASCALRELYEEVNVAVSPQNLIWRARYNTRRKPNGYTSFLVACLDQLTASQIQLELGDEGQGAGGYLCETFCRILMRYRTTKIA